jgi:hypothetical protein
MQGPNPQGYYPGNDVERALAQNIKNTYDDVEKCYNPKLHHICLPGIRPTHIPSLPKHLLKNLFENPLGSRSTHPNPLLHACERWQAYYSPRLPKKTQK